MKNSWLDIFQIICGSLVASLTFVDTITKQSYKKLQPIIIVIIIFLKNIWNKIAILALVTAAFIWINRQKNIISVNEKRVVSLHLDTVLRQHDSLNQIRLDTTIKRSTKAYATGVAETMAKYYLKYDSSQHKINQLYEDTANRKTVIQKIYSDAEPELELIGIKLFSFRNDTMKTTFTFKVNKSAIENLNIKLKIIYQKNNYLIFAPQLIPFLIYQTDFGTNNSWDVVVENITTLKNIHIAYFLLDGYYFYHSKKYLYHELYRYTFNDNSFGRSENPVLIQKEFDKYP